MTVAVGASLRVTSAPTRTHWCCWCGDCVTDLGYHWPDGSFNERSIEVSDEEVTESLRRAGYNPFNRNFRKRTRHAIALGVHIGTRT